MLDKFPHKILSLGGVAQRLGHDGHRSVVGGLFLFCARCMVNRWPCTLWI